MVKVLVMVGSVVIDQRSFKSEAHAIRFASIMQDRGYKIRLVDL